jgi:hypothetical protein
MVVVGYAFLLGMLLFVLDRYLDMRVVSYTADAQRQANNLLNYLLNNRIITKEKLIIDKSKLRDYAEAEWFSYPMSNYIERDTWEKNCEIPEYDYNFSVKGFNGEKYQFGNLIFNMGDKCYFEYQKIKGYIEMPISVYDSNYNSYEPGIASLTLMKTPLAEISFWISQSSLRLEEGYDDEVLKSVRVGPEVKSINIDRNGIICMRVNSYSTLACKRFYVNSDDDVRICKTTDLIPNGYEGKNCQLLLTTADLTLIDGCKAVNINATRNSIDLIIPGQ